MTPNSKLLSILTTPKRNKIIYGGRGSGKSWSICLHLIHLSRHYNLQILCLRQFQNRIKDSVYTLLKNLIKTNGYTNEFIITNNNIIHKKTQSRFLFYGIARNLDEILSLEGTDVCYFEEAHNITKDQLELISPTIRKDGSELYFVFNPKHILDFIFDKFIVNTPKNAMVCKINYNDNSYISKTFLEEVGICKYDSIEDYNHIYLGEPKSNDDMAIIKYNWVLSAIDSHIKLNIDIGDNINRIGYDVADSGADMNCMIHREGILCKDLDEWFGEQDELFLSSQKVYNKALEVGAFVIFDSIGVGAGVGSNFKRLGGVVKSKGFNASGRIIKPNYFYKHGVKNKDMFANSKAQSWWLIADMFLNTYLAIQGKEYDPNNIISISSKLPKLNKLIKELCTPLKKEDLNGKSKVESKKELSERGVKSPNCADAFIMAYTPIISNIGVDSSENGLRLPI